MKMPQFLKILLLVFALGGVIYAMRLLRSPNLPQTMNSPDNPIASLLGSELRPLNWCWAKTEKIEIHSLAKSFTDAASISKYCEIMIEPALQGDVQVDDYQVMALADGEGKTKKLEKNSKGVFRVEGFPFHSKQLEKQFY